MVDTTAAENMMVEKFRAKFRSIRDAFQPLDLRGKPPAVLKFAHQYVGLL